MPNPAQPLFSVILPFYNTESYLVECLRSILASSFRDFQLILVDDGSTDGSLAQCQPFTADPRVSLLRQPNQGVSAARNRGLDEARGSWVVFVDSDDLVSPEFLALAAREVRDELDLLLFDQRPLNRSPRPGTSLSPAEYAPEDALSLVKKMLTFAPLVPGGNAALPSPCGKVYRRRMLLEEGIRFPVDVKIGEDQIFNIASLLSARRCRYVPAQVYFPRPRLDSATHVCHPDFLETSLRFEDRLQALLKQRGVFPSLEEAFNTHALADMSYILVRGIFSPLSPRSYRENRELCRKMEAAPVYRRAMGYNRVNRRLMIRLLLDCLQLGWYRAVEAICRVGYWYLYRVKGM